MDRFIFHLSEYSSIGNFGSALMAWIPTQLYQPAHTMKAQGYCHFNNDGKNTSFRINLFDMDLDIEQDPDSRDLGHGAVVWDAAVVLAKYMEKNYKDYDTKTLSKRTVLELGSGCGLAGIAFMMKGAEVSCTDLLNVTQRLTEKNVKV
jgi:hypothetical protein